MSAKRNLTTFLLIAALLLTGGTLYGWITFLKVMKNTDGHIVRLAGDIHCTAFVEDEKKYQEALLKEKICLTDIEEPLTQFLNFINPQKEHFLIEKIIDEYLISAYCMEILKPYAHDFIIPLIIKLNILANPDIPHIIKALASTFYKNKINLNTSITTSDLRAHYKKIFYICFPQTILESQLLRESIIAYKKSFEQELEQHINQINNLDVTFKNFLTTKYQELLKNLEEEDLLEDFFFYELPDFKNVIIIGKSEKDKKNITLILGTNHCKNIAVYLEKIGYKSIFETDKTNFTLPINQNLPPTCSTNEFETFFTLASLDVFKTS